MQLPVFGIQYSLGNLWVAGCWAAMISRGQTVRIPTHARERAHTRTHTHTYISMHAKQHNTQYYNTVILYPSETQCKFNEIFSVQSDKPKLLSNDLYYYYYYV